MASIVILGPAYPFRGGGITTFNERLAKTFQQQGHDVTIYSFSLQYPSFLFPGKSQYSTEAPPADLKILSRVNSVNPFNWIATGNELKNLSPDIIIVRYWIPFMGPALGTILRRVKKNNHTRIIAIMDNVIPHEKRLGDSMFTKYFIKSCDAFVTMSDKVMADLRKFEAVKPAEKVLHPLYDNFGEGVTKEQARIHLDLPVNEKIILFFGFIRKYKGLDILLEAMRLSDTGSVKLLVAGEFYEDEKPYHEQIKQAGIEHRVILRTGFIPDGEVKYYICAADVVVQPYRSATQSGVTPLAYHFEKPMIVTNVGSLPDMVPNEKSGLVCEPEPASLAHAICTYFQLGEQHFIPHLRTEKLKYSWEKLSEALLKLAGSR